ncbi:hypothetical protein BGZ98_005009, partial [Dissophora globulifera]
PLSGAEFREHAQFTYTALKCLAKMAITSDGLLNDAQAVELPQLQGPSPVSLEAKHKDALAEEQTSAGSKQASTGDMSNSIVERKSQDYLKTMKRSDQKITVSGVMQAFIVMEINKQGRCTSISRLVVFGTGEENSVWEDSSHLVFKKITQIAVGAVDYFMTREPRSLLGIVMEWLATYSTLFTAPCLGCGKHLFFDSQQFKHLPPTLYTYNQPTTRPFHPQCLT